jgi:NADPH:quinone reductase-like Zn-dependent oxidoreductase
LILTAIGDIDETVALETEQDLTVGDDHVLLTIEAAPINPVDFIIASGQYGFQAQPPFQLGSEGIGRVAGAGSGVDQKVVRRRVLVVPKLRAGCLGRPGGGGLPQRGPAS